MISDTLQVAKKSVRRRVPIEQRNWLYPDEAGKEIGCAASTLCKRMGEYGGYRVGRNIRFDRAIVLASKTLPDFAHKPNATILALVAELEAQSVLNKQRHLQFNGEIEALKSRVADLERKIFAKHG